MKAIIVIGVLVLLMGVVVPRPAFAFNEGVFRYWAEKEAHQKSQDKESDLDGEWRIRAYVSHKETVLFDGSIDFENGRFLIEGDSLVLMPWEDEIIPKSVHQAGSFWIQNDRIGISNYGSMGTGWYFSGNYQVLLFSEKEKMKKAIRKISRNTNYFRLENKERSLYALFVSK